MLRARIKHKCLDRSDLFLDPVEQTDYRLFITRIAGYALRLPAISFDLSNQFAKRLGLAPRRNRYQPSASKTTGDSTAEGIACSDDYGSTSHT